MPWIREIFRWWCWGLPRFNFLSRASGRLSLLQILQGAHRLSPTAAKQFRHRARAGFSWAFGKLPRAQFRPSKRSPVWGKTTERVTYRAWIYGKWHSSETACPWIHRIFGPAGCWKWIGQCHGPGGREASVKTHGHRNHRARSPTQQFYMRKLIMVWWNSFRQVIVVGWEGIPYRDLINSIC